ncbi:hypothetical protein, partial [Mesomycoplasma ovipneumoniae]|uniref:hypothetical protein n=1 Tax=Mesomycoplasma ovipneumoniae TaxID=29562 RepID=UPI0030809957
MAKLILVTKRFLYHIIRKVLLWILIRKIATFLQYLSITQLTNNEKKIAESYRSRDDINKKQNKHNKKVEKTLMNSGWTSSVKSELKEVK